MKTLAEEKARVDMWAAKRITHSIICNGKALRVQGSYEDGTIAAAGSIGIRQEIELMALKTDLAAMPGKTDRITLPHIPGALFQPTNVQNDANGTHWLFNLKQVAS